MFKYLQSNDVERDDPSDLGDDGQDDGDQEQPDKARTLRRSANPANQAGEEESEAKSNNHVGEDLEDKNDEKGEGIYKSIAMHDRFKCHAWNHRVHSGFYRRV